MEMPKRQTDWALIAAAILVALTAGCHPKAQKEAWRPVPLPIAYEGSSIPGVMYFMNETDGTIRYGNRNPGEWMFSGPPSQEHLERCEAGSYKCVTGWASLAPIVVGDMPEDVRQQFPGLGIAVVRRRGPPCEVFETTPLDASDVSWAQKVVRCGGMGIVQVERRSGRNVETFNLKSATGLFGTALLYREADDN